jgi:hypothetical protein
MINNHFVFNQGNKRTLKSVDFAYITVVKPSDCLFQHQNV